MMCQNSTWPLYAIVNRAELSFQSCELNTALKAEKLPTGTVCHSTAGLEGGGKSSHKSQNFYRAVIILSIMLFNDCIGSVVSGYKSSFLIKLKVKSCALYLLLQNKGKNVFLNNVRNSFHNYAALQFQTFLHGELDTSRIQKWEK